MSAAGSQNLVRVELEDALKMENTRLDRFKQLLSGAKDPDMRKIV